MAGGADGREEPAPSAVELMMRYLDSLPQDFSVREELRSPKFWKALRAELLASLLVAVFVAAPGPPSGDGQRPDGAGRMALAYALTVATLVQCVGNVSGAHANPAVTVGLLVCRLVSPLRAAAYVAVQLLGALAGALILYGLTPPAASQLEQVASVRPGVTLTQAFGVEFLATFLVVLTTLATLDPVRHDVGNKALSIGVAYGVGAMFAVYWVGPTFGGILGGFTYEFVHESSAHGRCVRRSFRRRPGAPSRARADHQAAGPLGREVSGFSSATTECLQLSTADEVATVSRH